MTERQQLADIIPDGQPASASRRVPARTAPRSAAAALRTAERFAIAVAARNA
jgi:hypothetical protein